MRKFVAIIIFMSIVSGSMCQHMFDTVVFSHGGKIYKLSISPNQIVVNDTIYNSFPGFGTNHSSAAYGDHLHSDLARKNYVDSTFMQVGTFTEIGKNKFNPALCQSGQYFYNSTGALMACSATDFYNTGYQSVHSSTTYTLTKNRADLWILWTQLWFFTSSHVPISYVSVSNPYGVITFTTPANAAYIGINSKYSPTESLSSFAQSLQLELGNGSTTFEPYQLVLKKSLTQIPEGVLKTTGLPGIIGYGKPTSVVVKKPDIWVFTKYNDTSDLRTQFTAFDSVAFSNNVINTSSYLVKKGSNNITGYDCVILRALSDDAAPSNINGTFIGANHGCSDALLVTAAAHGKTDVDVGSEWKDNSNRKYYIVRIVDSGHLWVLSENIGASDLWVFDNSLSGSTLTHSANATHTGTITFTAYEQVQMVPAIKNRTVSIFLDGITQVGTTDSTYYCEYLDIRENYDIVNPASVVDSLKVHVGSNPAPSLANGTAVIRQNITYRTQSNGAVVCFNDWTTVQQVNLGYMGFIQQDVLFAFSTPLLKLYAYMPKVLPITAGATTYDLRNPTDYSYNPSAPLYYTPIYWENATSPPDRMIEFLSTSAGVRKAAYHFGYIQDIGMGSYRKDNLNTAWMLFTTRKSYPHGIDDKMGVIPAGKTYQGVCFKSMYDVGSNPAGRISFNSVDVGKCAYLYLDYSAAMIDNIPLPQKYAGMDISVVEKSSNLSIGNTVAADNLNVTVTSASPMYGYAVLKLQPSSNTETDPLCWHKGDSTHYRTRYADRYQDATSSIQTQLNGKLSSYTETDPQSWHKGDSTHYRTPYADRFQDATSSIQTQLNGKLSSYTETDPLTWHKGDSTHYRTPYADRFQDA
ncbi:MAG: hypothetical protein WCO44_12345, partial [Bacteroidota bacterium]